MPKAPREIVSQNLRDLIKEKGYRSVELFAHENGFDKGWLHRVLRAEIDPSLGRAINLALALEVSLNDIFPGKKKK